MFAQQRWWKSCVCVHRRTPPFLGPHSEILGRSHHHKSYSFDAMQLQTMINDGMVMLVGIF